MTNDHPETDGRAPLSASSAFVVHLTQSGLDLAENLHGRVEHITSGRFIRFTSVHQLVEFMETIVAAGSAALVNKEKDDDELGQDGGNDISGQPGFGASGVGSRVAVAKV